ncbi:hypothetical protein [Streptomyces sp. SID13726]|uniref:hypothetical protein n=1 Tax=Streptomyces sp. SID13726 TaxID=2706058 RepID=UPI0013BB3926|nr:hypothetical protein [Streptomyces sp. SID13726]NEB00598.1 hypothetical protein [Streptomyces sp. SID13726]
MSDVDQRAEAHRLQRERGFGARRVAAELGISRETAGELLSQPAEDPDPRLAVVTAAIVATVPRAFAATTMVTVAHRYTQAGRSACDSWTGRPERLAEIILAALDTAQPERPRPFVLAPRLREGAAQ